MFKQYFLFCCVYFIAVVAHSQAQLPYQVSIYTRAAEVDKMADTAWLHQTWTAISSQLHVDKIYLEIHRDRLFIEPDQMRKVISFFKNQGLKVAGGITFTIDESNNFETFCYSRPEHLKMAQDIIERCASLFDEIILDDFFFTSCKCNECIRKKGQRTWDEYRLQMMTGVAQNVIVGPAKKINPNVKVVVKYPNWYAHFHELGFNLETEPAIFDGLYTGTETRDAINSNQHLQPYLGFQLFRYFDHLKPGRNGGGWVDTYGSVTFDRYAEQLWLTLFAKAPEMTLFEYSAMASPLRRPMIAPWSNRETSFDYGTFETIDRSMAGAAQHALDAVKPFIGQLGNPIAIKSYRPFHADGEAFLESYLGMIGLPVDIVPEFPESEGIVLLTEQAAKDPDILDKMDRQLQSGKDVVITSGLVNALRGRGLDRIVDITYTGRKAMVRDFLMRFRTISGNREILIPQLEYYTNDSWEVISAMGNGQGWPLLHRGSYGNGNLYVLTIPENYRDLYDLPDEVLNVIRETLTRALPFRLQGPSQVALFPYDNQTMVVESFSDDPVDVRLITSRKPNGLLDLVHGATIEMTVIPEVKFWGRIVVPEQYAFNLHLSPHSFKAFTVK